MQSRSDLSIAIVPIVETQVVVNPAGTRLNLCAVLSQLGWHEAALEHAQAAVILLQEDLVAQVAAINADGAFTQLTQYYTGVSRPHVSVTRLLTRTTE